MAQAPLKNRMYKPVPLDANYKPQPQARIGGNPLASARGGVQPADTFSAQPGGNTPNQFSSMREAQQGGDRLGAYTRFQAPQMEDDSDMPQEPGYRRLGAGENVDLTGGAPKPMGATQYQEGGSGQLASAQGGIRPQASAPQGGGFQRVSPGLYRSPDGKIVRESQMKQMQQPRASAVGGIQPQAKAKGAVQPKPKARQTFKAR